MAMPEFTIRSESVDVEQIMEQIRTRIREKRGVDYTEEQLRELAAVKLERFLDPRGVRSDLLERFRQVQTERDLPPLPNYTFEEDTLYQTHRGPIRWIRKLLQPILKLFFNPNALIQALNIQSRLNTLYAEREAARHAFDQLHFELMHNLVVETTRIGIEVKNLKMQVESLGSRLEFNERRARALESAVVYAPAQRESPVLPSGAARQSTGMSQTSIESSGPSSLPAVSGPQEGPGQRSRRRRRRRGRRGGGSAATIMGGQGASPNQTLDAGGSLPEDVGGPAASTDTAAMSTAERTEVHAEPPDEPHSPAVESQTAEPRQSGLDSSLDASTGPGGSEPEQQ
jgi:hypothetical protein